MYEGAKYLLVKNFISELNPSLIFLGTWLLGSSALLIFLPLPILYVIQHKRFIGMHQFWVDKRQMGLKTYIRDEQIQGYQIHVLRLPNPFSEINKTVVTLSIL